VCVCFIRMSLPITHVECLIGNVCVCFITAVLSFINFFLLISYYKAVKTKETNSLSGHRAERSRAKILNSGMSLSASTG